jgi:transcriptional regulator with GAF, ATPase, and Fis domain/serine/threonine protein kinase/Tfp pilus assembly protein PilF
MEIGPYRVDVKLGEGGFAEVYRARGPQGDIALKVVKDPSDLEARTFLREEFKSLSNIRHPNVVSAYNFGFSRDGRAFFTMELLEGRHIDSAFRGFSRALLTAVAQLVGALNHIHNLGYVHGDIKPENVFITRKGKVVTAKLTDFGTAYNRGITASFTPAGSPLYMAPEIFTGRRPDARADLYSLGVVLYETLAGKSGLEKIISSCVLKDRLTVDLPPISSLVQGLPSPLEQLLERMTRRRPENRPRDAFEVLEALGRLHPCGAILPAAKRERALLSSGLVGRKKVISLLLEIVRNADSSKNTAALVTGGAGVGKSRLLRELRTAAQLEDISVFPVSCSESETKPLGPFSQFLSGSETGAEREHRMMRLEGARRQRLTETFEAVAAGINRLCDRSGKEMLLLADDIDLVGGETRSLLSYISNHCHPKRGLSCIATAKSDVWQDGVETITLAPLAKKECGRLASNILGLRPPQGLVDWLYEYSGGLPLLVEETLSWLHREGLIRMFRTRCAFSRDDLRGIKVPRTIFSLMGSLVDGLPGKERALLETASAVGDLFDEEVLASVLGKDETEISDLLRKLQSRNLILKESGAKYSFAHKWLSSRLYSGIDEKSKRRIHRRILKTVESIRPNEPGELARHALAAGLKTKTIKYSLAAAKEARRMSAYGTAIELLKAASYRLGKKEHRHSIVLEELADSQVWHGSYRDAISNYLSLVAVHEKRNDKARALRKAALCHYYLEDTASATSLLERARFLTEKSAGPERGRILLLSGWTEMKGRRFDKASDYWQNALESSRKLRDKDLESRILFALGSLKREHGDLPEARRLARKAISSARRSAVKSSLSQGFFLLGSIEMDRGDFANAELHLKEALNLERERNHLAGQGSTLVNLALVEQELGKIDSAGQHLEEALDIFTKLEDQDYAARAENNLGYIYDVTGLWDKALDHYARALEKYQKLGLQDMAALCHDNLGLLLVLRGETDEGMRHLKRAVQLAAVSADSRIEQAACVTMSDALAAHGKQKEALEWAERGDALAGKSGLSRGESLLQVSELRLFLSDRAGATDALNRALPLCETDPHARGRSLRLKAQLLPEGAGGSIRESFSQFKRIDDRFELAKTLLVEAAMYADGRLRPEEGRPIDQAVRCCENALDIFRALGAKPYVSVAARQLADQKKMARHVSDTADLYLRTIFAVNKMLEFMTAEGEVLDRILDRVIGILGAERGMVLLIDEDGNLVPAAGRNIDKQSEKDVTQISRTVVRNVAASRRPVTSGSASDDPRYMGMHSIALHGIKSLMCIPLTNKGETIGALYLDHKLAIDLFTAHDDEFLLTVGNLIAAVIDRKRYISGLESRNVELKRMLEGGFPSNRIVGSNREILAALKMIERAAATDESVLITGERGTGKGLVAKAIHLESGRRDGPFVTLDTALVPSGLIEESLFGHTRGSYSGAYSDAAGLIEAADGGTLFLNNAESIALDTQLKLVRPLKTREVRRIGSSKPRHVDFRIVSSTALPLKDLVERKEFRLDLLLLLDVLEIQLPPLRERGTDIYRLAVLFLEEFTARTEKRIVGFSRDALDAISAYDWPGNVAELKRAVQRAVSVCQGDVILAQDMGLESTGARAAGTSLRSSKGLAEVSELTSALAKSEGNVTRAGLILGISRRQVQRLLSKHGLKPSQFRPSPGKKST